MYTSIGQPRFVKLAFLEYTAYVGSDHPFLSISPKLLCISNSFMSNWVITKSRLYQVVFHFRILSLCVEVKL